MNIATHFLQERGSGAGGFTAESEVHKGDLRRAPEGEAPSTSWIEGGACGVRGRGGA